MSSTAGAESSRRRVGAPARAATAALKPGGYPRRMRQLLLVVPLLLACSRSGGALPSPGPTTPTPIPVVSPGGGITLVESWPVETTLDHPDLADTTDTWLQLVDAAKERLDIEQFYVSSQPGSHLDRVLEAVRRAADRGVAVRLVADTKFARTYPETLDALDPHPHIEVRRIDFGALTGGVQHAKFFIVDGKTAFVGSQNFDWRSLEHIQELGVVVDVPEVVDTWARVFAVDWAIAGGTPVAEALASARVGAPAAARAVPARYGASMVRVTPVASPTGLLPDEAAWDWPLLEGALAGARERVRLQALSYERVGYDKVEWGALDEALRSAAGRGVKVEMIVADWSKSGNKLESVQSLARVPGVTVKFVTIPEATTGFIPFARVVHSKYVVVDGAWSWIGTSNFSRDYFHGSRNLGLVVDGSAFAARLDRVFDDLWGSPYAEVVDPERADYQPPRRK